MAATTQTVTSTETKTATPQTDTTKQRFIWPLWKRTTELDAIETDARGLKVTDADSYAKAGAIVVRAKSVLKAITDHYEPFRKRALEIRDKILEDRDTDALDPQSVIDALEPQMKDWKKAEEERERERQRKAREEAQRKAEAERLRQKQELETAAKNSPPAVAQAIQNEIATLNATPVSATAPKSAPAVPPVAGLRLGKRLDSAEVFDIRALCRAVAEGKVSVEAVAANQTWLNTQARNQPDTFETLFPGCKFVKGE